MGFYMHGKMSFPTGDFEGAGILLVSDACSSGKNSGASIESCTCIAAFQGAESTAKATPCLAACVA